MHIYEVQWSETTPCNSLSFSINHNEVSSELNKVKIKILFTQEIMTDGTWLTVFRPKEHQKDSQCHSQQNILLAETSTQKNITTAISLAGLIVWCIATMSFVIHQHLYKAITRQIKNLVRFRGFFACLFFFCCLCNFLMVKTMNIFPVHLSVFVFLSLSVSDIDRNILTFSLSTF